MRNPKLAALVPYLFVIVAVLSLMMLNFNAEVKELSVFEYQQLLQADKVESSKVSALANFQ